MSATAITTSTNAFRRNIRLVGERVGMLFGMDMTRMRRVCKGSTERTQNQVTENDWRDVTTLDQEIGRNKNRKENDYAFSA